MKWTDEELESFWLEHFLDSPRGVLAAIALALVVYWLVGFMPR